MRTLPSGGMVENVIGTSDLQKDLVPALVRTVRPYYIGLGCGGSRGMGFTRCVSFNKY